MHIHHSSTYEAQYTKNPLEKLGEMPTQNLKHPTGLTH